MSNYYALRIKGPEGDENVSFHRISKKIMRRVQDIHDVNFAFLHEVPKCETNHNTYENSAFFI